METKHTPGPWKTFHNGGGQVGVSCGAGTITWVAGERLPVTAQVANAALIAAAPVLLNACIEAVTEMRDSLACPSDDWDCFDKLCAAITKATGKE